MALIVTARLRFLLSAPLRVEGESLKVITLNGVVCVCPYAASNLAQLISNTDMAVYNAKRSGKNKIVAYSLSRRSRRCPPGPH